MNELDDPLLTELLERASGPTPDADLAYGAVLRRVRRAKQRRLGVVVGGAGLACALGWMVAASLAGTSGEERRLVPADPIDVSTPAPGVTDHSRRGDGPIETPSPTVKSTTINPTPARTPGATTPTPRPPAPTAPVTSPSTSTSTSVDDSPSGTVDDEHDEDGDDAEDEADGEGSDDDEGDDG